MRERRERQTEEQLDRRDTESDRQTDREKKST
jgi:hypothetical protein